MGVQQARAQPINVITPVRRWWGWWLLATWPGAEHFRPLRAIVKRPLYRLSFIQFAHWGLLRRMPAAGGKRLKSSYVVFHTNYNGDANTYIDAFSIMVPWRIRGLWQGAIGFPGPKPLGRFRRFIKDHIVETLHYYCAYPDASLKIIEAGLELRSERDALLADARSMDDEEFAKRFDAFIAKHGGLL